MTVPARIWQTVASSLPGGVRACVCVWVWVCMGVRGHVCEGVHGCAWMCMGAHGCAWIHVLPVPAVPAPPHGVRLGDPRSPGAAGVLPPAMHACGDATPLRARGPRSLSLEGGAMSTVVMPLGTARPAWGGARSPKAQLPGPCQAGGMEVVLGSEEHCTFPYLYPFSFNPLLPTQGPDKSGKGKGHPQPPLMGYL